MERRVYSLVPERPSGLTSGLEAMVVHQPEFAHRLALNLRPIPTGAGVGGARQRAASRQCSALQARDVQDTDDIEERLVEPFSLLRSLLLLPSVALALVSFLRMMRSSSLLAISDCCFGNRRGR